VRSCQLGIPPIWFGLYEACRERFADGWHALLGGCSHLMNSQDVAERLRRLFWDEWDPLCVNGTPCPDDEYNSYADEVCNRLEAGATVGEIAKYLRWVEADQMGLSASGKADVVAGRAAAMALIRRQP
jgi:hypothetical protein